MRTILFGPALAVAACGLLWGCASRSETPLRRAETARELSGDPARFTVASDEPDQPDPPTRAGRVAESDLSGPVDRKALERALLARHPELIAASHRVRTLTAAARTEGALPEPTVMAQLWQVPLERPYAVDEADMLMVGVEQQFPAPGALGMREDARGHEALAELAMLRARARDLVRELQLAFADYMEATARHEVHLRHRALLERTASLAVARSAAGAPVTDATQAALELARVDAELAVDQGMREGARARINGLLLRRPGSPLGSPVKTSAPSGRASLEALVAKARAVRPELAAAAERRAAAQKALDASEREGAVPSFGLGASYFAPVGEMARHGYGLNVSASVPWLWGPRRAQVTTGEAQVRVAAAETRVVEATVDAEVATALATLEAVERRLAILRDVARPAARRAIDMAEAGYQAGGVDLLRVLAAAEGAVAVELDLVLAEGELERALAHLDRAVGASSSMPQPKETRR